MRSAVDELGLSLWVYQVVGGEEGEEKVPLREVCWPFGLVGGPEAWEVRVEAYAARPNVEVGKDLTAEFRGFEVRWK